MSILLAGLLSLVLAWIRGAPPTELASVRLRWMYLPVVAFMIQAVIFVLLERMLALYSPWLHLLSLGLLALFLVANFTYRSFSIIAIGVALNTAVIAANGGFMPVRLSDVERLGHVEAAGQLDTNGRFKKSKPLDGATHLPWLADVIRLPWPGRDRLISAGDVFIAAGAFLFVQEALVVNRTRRTRSVTPVTHLRISTEALLRHNRTDNG